MKHVNQTRALFLSCCLLVLARWSAAQVGLLPAVNGASKTATTLSEAVAAEINPETITIPAGTHLLMRLISPLHTTSSTPGSGVYLETAFPVVESNRVVIPEHTRVMGVVTDERRPGRVRGRARMRITLAQLILPDNRELSVVGSLQSLPGSSKNRTVNNEGTLEPVDQIDADVYTVAKTTGAGVLVGSIRHVGIGVGPGALIGAGLGLAKVLFTRGDDISLPVGTKVEMVLQRPLTVQPVSSSALADCENTASRPSIPKEQNAHQPADNVPCLRDGVTFQCVTPRTVTVSPVEPVSDR
jgi:type IV secretion system protein VirB10